MDLIDQLHELAGRIRRQKDSVLTEEAAKTAFVLPFIRALGYDVFNPAEVIPELTADHGVKKGEKVDYGIKQNDSIVMLIECKPVGADLAAKHAGQLFRYFSVTESHFGVLTDGIRYLFFSDLDKENKMDDRPFFEFNLLNFTETDVNEIKKFTKTSFDLETIISTASNLKFHRSLLSELEKEHTSPSEDLVRLLAGRVYVGRLTQQVKDQFRGLVHSALKDFVRQKVDERLKSALNTDGAGEAEAPRTQTTNTDAVAADVNGDIETTDDERDAFRIVQAICAAVVDVERITMRDAKSYCAILLDDNNRKPISRLHFMKRKKAVSLFPPSGEMRIEIEKLSDLFGHQDEIRATIAHYTS